MKITRKETREVTVVVVEDVMCDRCGKSMKGHIGNINGLHLQGSGSYDSTHFPDMYSFEADVCEACVIEWFKTFQRDPIQEIFDFEAKAAQEQEEGN